MTSVITGVLHKNRTSCLRSQRNRKRVCLEAIPHTSAKVRARIHKYAKPFPFCNNIALRSNASLKNRYARPQIVCAVMYPRWSGVAIRSDVHVQWILILMEQE